MGKVIKVSPEKSTRRVESSRAKGKLQRRRGGEDNKKANQADPREGTLLKSLSLLNEADVKAPRHSIRSLTLFIEDRKLDVLS